MSKIGCEILEISPERVKFALNNCDISMANSLRRVIIAQTPTLAPHLINIYENTSILHDQFLVQRLGLIPFYSQRVDDYQYTWECQCNNQNIEDCQVCKAYFRLQVHNKQQHYKQVTSLDIEPVFQPIQVLGSQKRPVLPVEFKSGAQKNKTVGIPIVKLAKNQEINIRFNVEKGIGKMHSRWSPVSLATFQPDPEIKIDQTTNVSLKQKQQIRDSCPTKVYEVHQGILEAVNPQKCIFCGQCQKKAESISMARLKNFIRIGTKKDRFIFTVESVGSMPAASIVKKAIGVLREKLQLLQQKMK